MAISLKQAQHQELSINSLFQEYLEENYALSEIKLNNNYSLIENIEHFKKIYGKEFAKITKEALIFAYDTKYGNWDEVNDLRKIHSNSWADPIKHYFSKVNFDTKIIDLGCNDGRELSDILGSNINKPNITVLDISKQAIARLRFAFHNQRNVSVKNDSIVESKIRKESYDFCIALRTVHSSGIDMEQCVKKCIDITKKQGYIILSVANGYVDIESGNPIKGMYIDSTDTVDTKMPYNIAEQIKNMAIKYGIEVVDIIDGETEIFIIVKK
jgi:SAM-dependent methyltransferase